MHRAITSSMGFWQNPLPANVSFEYLLLYSLRSGEELAEKKENNQWSNNKWLDVFKKQNNTLNDK